MNSSPSKVFFKGQSLSLAGRKLTLGNIAPDSRVSTADFQNIRLSDLKRRVKILTSFISLDTPVCDLQVKKFNQMVSSKSKDVLIVGLSKDLPFAQKRFCDSFSIGNVQLLSDYQTSSFGINYGLLIQEWNLLARAVLIVDENQIIRYSQIVKEITNPPDYDDVLKNLDIVARTPKLGQKAEKKQLRCVPCEGKTAPLNQTECDQRLTHLTGWNLVDGIKLVKEFRCKDFVKASNLLNWIGIIAEDQGHHPTMTISYNKLKATLTTHAAGGLTENDFILAQIIDELHPLNLQEN